MLQASEHRLSLRMGSAETICASSLALRGPGYGSVTVGLAFHVVYSEEGQCRRMVPRAQDRPSEVGPHPDRPPRASLEGSGWVSVLRKYKEISTCAGGIRFWELPFPGVGPSFPTASL